MCDDYNVLCSDTKIKGSFLIQFHLCESARRLYTEYMRTIAYKRFFWSALLWSVLSVVLYCQPTTTSAATAYPAVPATDIDTFISGTADGQQLVFQKELVHHPAKSNRYNITWTRFSGSGPVSIDITTQTPIGNYAARSIGRDIPAQHSGNNLKFTLPEPGNYYLKLSNSDRTYLFFYDSSSVKTYQPGQPNVVDVRSKGITPNAGGNQGDAIQQAINSCPQNCVLYFPPGLYHTGRLSFEDKSNMTFYVDKGATIRGVDNPDLQGGVGGELLWFTNSNNITISGLGVIDANGPGTWNYDGREVKIHNADVYSSNTITFENVLFRNSNSWAIHVYGTNNFTADNIKVFSGKDGIDPDSAQNVVIKDVAIVSVDDSVAVKSRGGQNTVNVQVTNCLVSSTKTALKIGTENRRDISGVTFDTCEVFDGERGLSVSTKAGGAMSNITYRNIRLWMIRWPGEGHTGKAFYINHDDEEGSQNLNGLTFENIYAYTFRDNTFEGGNNIVMRNINMYLAPSDNKDVFFGERGSDIRVEGITFYWLGNKGSWDDTFSSRDRDWIVTDKQEFETGGPAMAFPSPPLQKACGVEVLGQSVTEGSVGRVVARGISTNWISEPTRLIFTQQNGQRLSPTPQYTQEIENQGKYFYLLDAAACTTGGGVECGGASDIPSLPIGMYTVFCDMPTSPSQCSGNPHCSFNGGSMSCDGWRACSDEDSESYQVLPANASPTPPASPTNKPGDTDSDGDVDIFDYNTIVTAFGTQNCTYNQTGSCLIDIFDYNIVITNFGK